MPDRALIGKESSSTRVIVGAEAIREFARVVGETNPIYFDTDAAREAGYANIVAPPTFPVAFMTESMDPDLFIELGLDIPSIVHAEQEFEYVRPLVAGEALTLRGRIGDMWEKQGRSGPLDFVVLEAIAHDSANELVYTSRITLVARRSAEAV